MGIPVMVYGESGTGKSASMRNWQAGEVSIVNVSGKPLPFRNRNIAEIRTADYAEITRLLSSAKARTVVIDDASYLLVDEYMRNAKQGGFQKFTDMALHFYNLIRFVIDRLPDEKIVFFLGHVERDQNGNEKFKTVGRLLDEKVTVEGLFTIVLKTRVSDGAYRFTTQNSGADTVKSPAGMFPAPEIENDLKAVEAVIRDYYGI